MLQHIMIFKSKENNLLIFLFTIIPLFGTVTTSTIPSYSLFAKGRPPPIHVCVYTHVPFYDLQPKHVVV